MANAPLVILSYLFSRAFCEMRGSSPVVPRFWFPLRFGKINKCIGHVTSEDIQSHFLRVAELQALSIPRPQQSNSVTFCHSVFKERP